MAQLTCLNCHAVISTAEAAAGWCDSCGKRIPVSYIPATPANRNRRALQDDAAVGPRNQRHFGRILGTLLGALFGLLLSCVLTVGPLWGTGWILPIVVGLVLMVVGLGLGQIVGGLFTPKRA